MNVGTFDLLYYAGHCLVREPLVRRRSTTAASTSAEGRQSASSPAFIT
jgi:hypothetical protein